MNDWVDVQCIFNVGRGLRHGLVPYRDLVDHKGPVTYFLFFFASLISESSTIGLFIIEVISFTLFLSESYKIIRLYTDTDSKTIELLLPLIVSLLAASFAFEQGGSVEELSIPFMALSLRLCLTCIRKNSPLSAKNSFIVGFCASLAFWIKYTLVGFFAGLALGLIVLYIKTKNHKFIFQNALFAVLGFLSLSFLVLGSFYFLGGLSDLIKVYFGYNLFLYKDGDSSFVRFLYNGAHSVYHLVSRDGFEESYGYLSGTYVRDKDAVDAAFLICEMFAYYKTRGISLLEKLDEIWKTYGFCLNVTYSYEFEGSAGMTKMNDIMEVFRKGADGFGGLKVEQFLDYGKGLDGLPKSNVLKFALSDNCSVVVRPSGTEPKLKTYLSVSADTEEKAHEIEQRINDDLKKLVK